MPHASVTIVDETGTLYNFAELKLLMTNENVSTIVRTSRKNQPSPMTTTKEEGPNFGSQYYHNSNSQHNSNSSQRFGNSYSQPYNKNQNFSNQNHNNQSNSNQDRISELDKITTTFPQGRVTTPILSITEISLRTILMLSLTMCNSLMTILKR